MIPGPDFPTGGADRRAVGHRAGLPDRPRQPHDPREGDRRGVRQGRPQRDHRHRGSLPGQQGEADREDRRAGARQDARGHLRPARRVGPRGPADRHRAEARRGGGRRPEQPVQAHAAADQLRRDHARDRRRPPARPVARRGPRALRGVPARRGAPADRVRTAEGRGARPHPRGPEDRPRPHRRGHRADPRVEVAGRGARRPDGRPSASARSSRRRSSRCSCSG